MRSGSLLLHVHILRRRLLPRVGLLLRLLGLLRVVLLRRLLLLLLWLLRLRLLRVVGLLRLLLRLLLGGVHRLLGCCSSSACRLYGPRLQPNRCRSGLRLRLRLRLRGCSVCRLVRRLLLRVPRRRLPWLLGRGKGGSGLLVGVLLRLAPGVSWCGGRLGSAWCRLRLPGLLRLCLCLWLRLIGGGRRPWPSLLRVAHPLKPPPRLPIAVGGALNRIVFARSARRAVAHGSDGNAKRCR